ncbi:MAG: type II secretion system protein N [Gallionella sp.]|nr:type II secretion system protein N [Gallionella sp.]
MRRPWIWLLAGTVSIALSVLAFFPATWLAAWVATQTDGRLMLGDARGTLWRGEAFIGGAAHSGEPLAPLLPGRFAWRLSPMILLGQVDLDVHNTTALSQPVQLTGNWQQWQASPAALSLPAERLVALGAPLNTLQPAGQMRLSWQPLQFTRIAGRIEMSGTMNLSVTDLTSRLSPIDPLGSYDLALVWRASEAAITLVSLEGPMLLAGTGVIRHGHGQFSGTAQAATGQEDRLANLLNLIGQRRNQGDRNIIALEFK